MLAIGRLRPALIVGSDVSFSERIAQHGIGNNVVREPVGRLYSQRPRQIDSVLPPAVEGAPPNSGID